MVFNLYSKRENSSGELQSEGYLLNTNTIDTFKNIDKKKILETLSKKVHITYCMLC